MQIINPSRHTANEHATDDSDGEMLLAFDMTGPTIIEGLIYKALHIMCAMYDWESI